MPTGRRGEFIGLPVAFLQAGASGVIGTLWPVDDVSTALVMMKFYDLYLAKGTPPALALRQAQLWLRDAGREEVLAFLAGMRRLGRLLPQHEAQLAASLSDGSGDAKPFSHPFYWAAFQFYGS
jgi:CHAT domain-containing protein